MKGYGQASTVANAAGTKGLICDGDWVESKDQNQAGEVRLIQLADIGLGEYLNKSNRRMTMDAARRLRCTFLNRGDILIARMPDPIGRSCIFPGDASSCVTVVDICVLRVDRDVAYAPYIVHAINAPSFLKQINRFVKGTTRQRISRTSLEALPLPLPPLDEQRRIAAILDQAENLRRKRRLTLEKLNTLPEAIFQLMFGPSRVKSEGYPVQSLGELISVSSGDALTQAQIVSGPFPVYGGNGINGYHNDFMVPPGTTVIGRVGVYCGAVHVTISNAWVTDNALIVSIKNGAVQPTYLAAALTNVKLNQYAGRSAQPLISGGRIYPIKIPVPPRAEQERFASAVTATASTSQACHEQTLLGEKLFASLQSRAFYGEL